MNLNELKVGDPVTVLRRWADEVVRKIDRITKTQVEVNNCKYNRNTGLLVGGDMFSASIRPATEADIAAHNLRQLQGKVKKELEAKLKTLPADQLELILAILQTEH
jgi:hypothetical protein